MRIRLMSGMLCGIMMAVSISTAQIEYGWTRVAKPTNGLAAVFFLDSLHGWTARDRNMIYRTIDGGTTWQGYPGDKNGFGIYSISFADSLHGWCVGSDGSGGYVIRTRDGGRTWKDQWFNYQRVFLAIHAFSPSRAIIAANRRMAPTRQDVASVFMTSDSGSMWQESVPTQDNGYFEKIQFLDSLNGFVWGSNTLYGTTPVRTRDGGRTWIPLARDPRIRIAFFIDTLRGWGAYDTRMHHTTDGGKSWEFLAVLDTPDQLSMTGLQFTDSLNGWAWGDRFFEGVIVDGIYKTIDGGRHWVQDEVGLSGAQSTTRVTDATMLNNHLGWAVCGNGGILKYQAVTTAVVKIPDRTARSFELHQNFPNPFNPSTTIEYELKRRQAVSLLVTDELGRHVISLITNSVQDAGVYRVRFDASSLSSGTYYYTIYTEEFTETRSMMLTK